MRLLAARFAKVELDPVINHADAQSALVFEPAQNFDEPRNDAEYVCGFVFNERNRLVSQRRA